MNKQVPEGTFRVEVEGAPQSQAELEAVAWALGLGNWRSPQGEFYAEPEVFEGQYFTLPYAQGGGFVQITRNELAVVDARLMTEDEREYAVQALLNEVEKGATYTNYWFVDWYTDSMTCVYESPILRSPEGELYMVEP